MPIGANIQAWRLTRNQSVSALAERAELTPAALAAIEADQADPPVSSLERIASALGISVSWLFGDPKHVELLTADPDGEPGALPPFDSLDPVTERILRASRQARGLYTLLTALLRSEDEKLIRAAEVSLRSLLKQTRTAPLPWQNRRPGNFDPPSD